MLVCVRSVARTLASPPTQKNVSKYFYQKAVILSLKDGKKADTCDSEEKR
jgi:hypothetical protein